MNDRRRSTILRALSFRRVPARVPARRAALVAALLAALLLAGCAAAEVQPTGTPTSPPLSTPAGSPSPDLTPVPGASSLPGNPGGGPGTPPDPDMPVSTAPPPGGGGPGEPQPTVVVPRPGRLGVHQVSAVGLSASVEGQRVRVTLTWWSGVEPCAVLDSIGVEHGANTIALTIREGSDALGVACIEIAMLKAAVVDLGELAPGTWTISALGDAPPVTVTIG